MTHRLATNYAKNYCYRTPIVKVIVENVVTCFLGHSVVHVVNRPQTQCSGQRRISLNVCNVGCWRWASKIN